MSTVDYKSDNEVAKVTENMSLKGELQLVLGE